MDLISPPNTLAPRGDSTARASDTLAVLGLLLALLGPIFLGLGELIGLALCVLSVSRRRNTVRGTIMAWVGIIVSLAWCVLLGFGAFYFLSGKACSRNESRVMVRLEKAACVEFSVKYALLEDADGNGNGEYVAPDRFDEIPGLDLKAREMSGSPALEGYNYYFENVSADTFSITAVPKIYNVTGRKTFFVSEEGIVVAEDLKGERFKGDPLADNEDPGSGSTIFRRHERKLSEKLLSAAEKRFKVGEHELCRKILENLKNNLPDSSLAERADALDKENAKALLEISAANLCADAQNYLKNGKKDPALVMLRAVAADYPGTLAAREAAAKAGDLALELAKAELKLANALVESNYWFSAEESLEKIARKYPEAMAREDFSDQVSSCRRLSNERRDSFAAQLLAEAEKLEFAGDSVKAYNAYLQIKENYGGTPAAGSVDAGLGRLKNQMDEKTAERYILDVMKNVALTNDVEVLNKISLLVSACGETKAYKRAEDVLERARKKCLVRLLGNEADEFMAKGNFVSARDKFEQLIKEKPEALEVVKGKLERCLTENFEAYYANGDYEEALETFERYDGLKAPLPIAERGQIDECYYKSGTRLYQEGDIRLAVERLEKCYQAYRRDAHYNFIAGRANAAIGRWEPSVRHLTACGDLDGRNALELFSARAYARMHLCVPFENNLIAMFVANRFFYETVSDYGWLKIVYAELAPSNGVEKVGNVAMRIVRERTSGKLIVMVEKPERGSFAMPGFNYGTGGDKDTLYAVDRSYQDCLVVMNDRIRELEHLLNCIIKTNIYSKKVLWNRYDQRNEAFERRIRELASYDYRESLENGNILGQIKQDIANHKTVLEDLRAVLRERNIPELREAYAKVSEKVRELEKSAGLLRGFIKARNKRNEEIDLFLKDVADGGKKHAITPEKYLEAVNVIRKYCAANDKAYVECVESFVDSINVEVDLSCLEQFLPNVKE